MIPKAMDSLDLVEAVMLIEEVFGTEIPTIDAEHFAGPREIVDWLELHLSNQRPNKEAAALLRKLARDHNNPELAEGLEGTWRRAQRERRSISAYVLKIVMDHLALRERLHEEHFERLRRRGLFVPRDQH